MHYAFVCVFILMNFIFMFYDHGARLPSLTATVCWSRPLHRRYEGWGRDNNIIQETLALLNMVKKTKTLFNF